MTLTSFPFLVFAAVTVLLYYLLPKRGQWVVLLAAVPVPAEVPAPVLAVEWAESPRI